MRFSITTLIFGAVASSQLTLAAPADNTSPNKNHHRPLEERALGINCRGSSLCTKGGMDQLASAARGIKNRGYSNGEHIVCLAIGAKAGHCAFLQGTSRSVPGSSIAPLLDALVAHGCQGCGSVPTVFLEGSNDPGANGILTVNYVADRGDCNNSDMICEGARP